MCFVYNNMVRLTICKCFFLFHNPVPSPFLKDSNFANLRMEPWGQGLGSVSWEAFVSPPAPHSIIHIQLEMNSVYNVDNTVFVATFSQTFQDFFYNFLTKKQWQGRICWKCSAMWSVFSYELCNILIIWGDLPKIAFWNATYKLRQNA